MNTKKVQLTRNVEAIQIPSGNVVTLTQGLEVVITQALGGTYTVHAPTPGGLFRIGTQDHQALGLEPEQQAALATTDAGAQQLEKLTEAMVWNALKTCYDPEIPVNIVDLGLIYSLKITPLSTGRNRVNIQMTLTAPGCGMGPSIARDAQSKVLDLPQVEEAHVELVWEPPWSPGLISQEGRITLGIE